MPKAWVTFITLFSSLSTLLCCALPALLVTLGLGASLASFLGSYPELIWFSEHKLLVFIFAGVMLAVTAIGRWQLKDRSCPLDPELAKLCARTKIISTLSFYGSLGIYALGFFFAFIAPYVF